MQICIFACLPMCSILGCSVRSNLVYMSFHTASSGVIKLSVQESRRGAELMIEEIGRTPLLSNPFLNRGEWITSGALWEHGR